MLFWWLFDIFQDNSVHLEKCSKMSVYLKRSASIQPRTNPPKCFTRASDATVTHPGFLRPRPGRMVLSFPWRLISVICASPFPRRPRRNGTCSSGGTRAWWLMRWRRTCNDAEKACIRRARQRFARSCRRRWCFSTRSARTRMSRMRSG